MAVPFTNDKSKKESQKKGHMEKGTTEKKQK